MPDHPLTLTRFVDCDLSNSSAFELLKWQFPQQWTAAQSLLQGLHTVECYQDEERLLWNWDELLDHLGRESLGQRYTLEVDCDSDDQYSILFYEVVELPRQWVRIQCLPYWVSVSVVSDIKPCLSLHSSR